ncbi:MAG: PAS domain-containing protein [Pseudomonadota bacterium]
MSIETDLMKNVMNNTDVVLFIKDENGRFVMANHGFEKMFKLTKDKIVGKSDSDLVSKPEDLKSYRDNDMRVLKEDKPIAFTEFVDLPDGRHKCISYKFPVTNISGVKRGVGCVAIDITRVG